MIDQKDLYWLAGLIEGEGYFGIRHGYSPTVSLQMTDKDIVDRAHCVLGFGLRHERTLPSGKGCYSWTVLRQAQAAGLMMTLLPLMGARRAARITECLTIWRAVPTKRLWATCRKGHLISGNNLALCQEGKYLKRRCRQCLNARARRYRERQRQSLKILLAPASKTN